MNVLGLRGRGNRPAEAPLARRLYSYEFLGEFVLLYPLYALLFADHGLSVAEISALFILWSVTSFTLDLPLGVLADVVSRRLLLVLAPVFTAAAFALWTWWPSLPVFAAGFVLWGIAAAMRSGTLQALVYAELERLGRTEAFPRLIGRARALALVAVLVASALASPVLALGGYTAVGGASAAIATLGAVVAWTFPAPRNASGQAQAHAQGAGGAILRDGLRAFRRVPQVRYAVVLVALLSATEALEEYVPLLARESGASDTTIPLLVMLFYAGSAAGGVLAGYGTRWMRPVLVSAPVLVAGGALSGHPAGIVGLAVAFGIFTWANAAAEDRLQRSAAETTRATVASLAGVGREVLAVLIFAGFALGSLWTSQAVLFTVVMVPYMLLALFLGRGVADGAHRGAG